MTFTNIYSRGKAGEIESLISRKVMLSLCNIMIAEENFVENLRDGKFTV